MRYMLIMALSIMLHTVSGFAEDSSQAEIMMLRKSIETKNLEIAKLRAEIARLKKGQDAAPAVSPLSVSPGTPAAPQPTTQPTKNLPVRDARDVILTPMMRMAATVETAKSMTTIQRENYLATAKAELEKELAKGPVRFDNIVEDVKMSKNDISVGCSRTGRTDTIWIVGLVIRGSVEDAKGIAKGSKATVVGVVDIYKSGSINGPSVRIRTAEGHSVSYEYCFIFKETPTVDINGVKRTLVGQD